LNRKWPYFDTRKLPEAENFRIRSFFRDLSFEKHPRPWGRPWRGGPGLKPKDKKIIQKYFWKADKEINRKVLPFDFITGEWDHIVFFPLEDGTNELDWVTSPVNAKLWEAMVKEIGSEDEVKRIRQQFDNCVMKSNQELAFTQY
jgi:hypothetical protein